MDKSKLNDTDVVRYADAQSRNAQRRPPAFLVSTTACAGNLPNHVGDADYSYAFVLNQLAPALERLGTWKRIDQPESSLLAAARSAAAAGYRPIHLALNPPQNCYFTPAVPTILLPFWEFPDVPNRDFGFDTRQNWLRMCRHVDRIVVASHEGAKSFRRAAIDRPVHVVPIPIDPRFFEVPVWNPTEQWNITCRHFEMGGASEPLLTDQIALPGVTLSTPQPPPRLDRARQTAGRWSLAIARRLIGNERTARLREYALRMRSQVPPRGSRVRRTARMARHVSFDMARAIYRRLIVPWLSPEALARISRVKERVVRHQPSLPLLPATPLKISGLVYTSVFNLSDRRKNIEDLLSGFLLAFQDRPEVTLVLKLATNPSREFHEVQLFRNIHATLGIRHRCRVVVITDYLSDEEMIHLARSTTYYLNASRAEGACLPLQEALAAGRPALAPAHTAMADYMDDQVGFVLETHPEPTFWPHDPQRHYETYWNRLVWSDLRDRLLESATLVQQDRSRYIEMAHTAQARLKTMASRDAACQAMRKAIDGMRDFDDQCVTWAA